MSSGESDTRSALLDAAVELLQASGGWDLSLGEVARRAGVSRQAVYLHFDSRAALVIASVEHLNARLRLDARLDEIRSAPDAVTALELSIETLCWHTSRAATALVALRHILDTDAEAAEAWKRRPGGRRNHLAAIAARLGAEGHLRRGLSAQGAADILAAIAQPAVFRELVEGRGWSRKRATGELVRLARVAVTD